MPPAPAAAALAVDTVSGTLSSNVHFAAPGDGEETEDEEKDVAVAAVPVPAAPDAMYRPSLPQRAVSGNSMGVPGGDRGNAKLTAKGTSSSSDGPASTST